MCLTYRENPLATGITVNLQESTDLTSAPSPVTPSLLQTVGTDKTNGDPIVEIGVVPSGSTEEFIRLDVTSP